ncbi:amino acid ABC transporter permease [Streptococcus sp. DD13]|uniref:amino acid ABC transporter permease n=1 Tax=Streptococcus sp. DD13 TaxID=1777881 RepID=UPI00079A6D2C|nr:amino acid ABC transporter permease [Streptococcus sp. DD13]KXT77753.1 amino acid ABC transporter, permease protein [Streptococcus sp. DD13]
MLDFQYMVKIFPRLMEKIPLSFLVVVIAGFFSLVLAAGVAFVRIKRVPVLKQLASLYVSFMRSTPGILHIFIVYYGLPLLVQTFFGIDIRRGDKLLFSLLALILYNGAFVSEILRPGYLAVPQGQKEAALAIGLSPLQANLRILFPQMIPIVLPSLGNAAIDLLKDTSLLYLIGMTDIMGLAENLISLSYGTKQLEVYFLVGLLFWGMSTLISLCFAGLEKLATRHLV